MQYLKQNTATDVLIGPFLDSSDGYTAETGVSPSVKLSKNGQALAVKNDVTTPVHDADGYYNCELDATDTNTLGMLTLSVVGSAVSLPVRHEYMVVPANAFDSLVGGTDTLETDAIAISGDTIAADNLELMYDGTGYTDDTAPASRSQVGQLSTSSAAISTTAAGVTITTGTETGTFANTSQLDDVYHSVADVANVTDFYYEFSVGGDGVPTEFVWDGYAQSNGDTWRIYAYNWAGTSWDQIGSVAGANGTTKIQESFQATNAHVGTGADLGKVRFRVESTDGTEFFTDRILCSYAVVARSVGYSTGAIWVNTTVSNTNTESYVDGTADNPVSTWAAALTLSSQLGIKKFRLSSGSSITLTANSDYYEIEGGGASINLGGQSIEGGVFVKATISGTGIATVDRPTFDLCTLSAPTIPPSVLLQCGFFGTTTLGSAGSMFAFDCASLVAGSSTPVFDLGLGLGPTNLVVRRYGGGLTINNSETGDLASLEATVGGTLTINGTGGEVFARGQWSSVVDGSGGSVTVNDQNIDLGSINDQVDTALVDYDGPTKAEMDAGFAALNDITVADIAAMSITELTTIPGASPELKEAVSLLYMALRNKLDVTNAAKEIHNDAGTVLATKSLSDDGTTYSESKMA